eukprot:2995293-Karenia_brevis.AAC.1
MIYMHATAGPQHLGRIKPNGRDKQHGREPTGCLTSAIIGATCIRHEGPPSHHHHQATTRLA